jgi:hypothetical protein
MCIGNGVPAFVGRFMEQTVKGFMWKDIGLANWLFDSDSIFDMERLVPQVLWLANNPEKARKKALVAKEIVEYYQARTMKVLEETLEKLV